MHWVLYIVKRFLLLVPLLLGVTLVVFVLTRVVIPGNPVDRMVPPMASDQLRAQIAEKYGLNQPIPVQYLQYLEHLVHGDMGTSFSTSHPVSQDLIRFFPATFELTTYAMMVAVLIGVPLGILAALRRDTWLDHVSRFLSVSGVAIPVFWLSLVVIYLFFYKWHIAPPPLGRLDPRISPPAHVTGLYVLDSVLTGNWQALWGSVKTLIMPVLVLAVGAMAPLARMARSGMVEALDSQYVTAARALGLPTRSINYHYALKNAVLPVITMLAFVYAYLLGGSVLVENIFSWPGLGRYAYNAISGSDYPAIEGFILYSTTMYVLVFLIADVIYRIVDPRIRKL